MLFCFKPWKTSITYLGKKIYINYVGGKNHLNIFTLIFNFDRYECRKRTGWSVLRLWFDQGGPQEGWHWWGECQGAQPVCGSWAPMIVGCSWRLYRKISAVGFSGPTTVGRPPNARVAKMGVYICIGSSGRACWFGPRTRFGRTSGGGTGLRDRGRTINFALKESSCTPRWLDSPISANIRLEELKRFDINWIVLHGQIWLVKTGSRNWNVM